MLRAMSLLALAASCSAMTIWATASRSAADRAADHQPLLVEIASPRLAPFAMTIL